VGHLYNYFFLAVFLIGAAICLFSERIWMATGHTDRGSRCERQHFRTGAIASRIARFDCWFTFLMRSRVSKHGAKRFSMKRTRLARRFASTPAARTSSDGITEATSGICPDTGRLHPDGQVFSELPTLIERSNNIQQALWQQVKALFGKDNNMVPTGLFIQALNEMIDNGAFHVELHQVQAGPGRRAQAARRGRPAAPGRQCLPPRAGPASSRPRPARSVGQGPVPSVHPTPPAPPPRPRRPGRSSRCGGAAS